MARPRLFTIAPGAPFLPTFARALLAGDILPTVSAARGPLALADTTIYVPTRRAARALISQLAGFVDSGAVLLPKIRPLGAVDEEAALFADPLDRGSQTRSTRQGKTFANRRKLPGATNQPRPVARPFAADSPRRYRPARRPWSSNPRGEQLGG